MRHLLAASALLNAGLLAGLSWKVLGVHAETLPNCAVLQNGDVNADARLDISDAVALLGFLFQGGSGPTPQFVADNECVVNLREELAALKGNLADCRIALADTQRNLSDREAALAVLRADLATREAELSSVRSSLQDCENAMADKDSQLVNCQAKLAPCQSELEACQLVAKGSSLPATGQSKCYGAPQGGAQPSDTIDCASVEFPGQDGFYQAGCPLIERFVDNGDGTVTDACTRLMWQIDTADVSGNGTIGEEDRLSWRDALKYCENLDVAGYSDWRLPNLRELQSIVDYGRWEPAIDTMFGADSNWGYWSSSSVAQHPHDAWYINMTSGQVNYSQKSREDYPQYVRALRNAR